MHLPTDRSWKDWRPHNDWVIARADPRVKKTAGGILLTDAITAIERVMEGTARVLKVGRSVNAVLGYPLAPGERICFRGFLKDAFHEFADDEGCRVFMLKADDILAVIAEDVEMGAYSGERKAADGEK